MYISYKIVKCVVTASIISGRIGNFWLFAAVFFLLVECKQIDDYLVIETIKPDNLSSCDNKQEMNAKKETKTKTLHSIFHTYPMHMTCIIQARVICIQQLHGS